MDIEDINVGDWIGKNDGRGFDGDPDGTIYVVLHTGDKYIFIARQNGNRPADYNLSYYSEKTREFLKTCTVNLLRLTSVTYWHIVKKGNVVTNVVANQSKEEVDSQYKKDVKFFFGDPTKHKRGNSGLEFL